MAVTYKFVGEKLLKNVYVIKNAAFLFVDEKSKK